MDNGALLLMRRWEWVVVVVIGGLALACLVLLVLDVLGRWL